MSPVVIYNCDIRLIDEQTLMLVLLYANINLKNTRW